MAKNYTGKVDRVTSAPPGVGRSEVTMIFEGSTPKAGDTVKLTVVLTDEEIGKRLREELTSDKSSASLPPPSRADVAQLADHVEYVGWEALAELIREVGP